MGSPPNLLQLSAGFIATRIQVVGEILQVGSLGRFLAVLDADQRQTNISIIYFAKEGG